MRAGQLTTQNNPSDRNLAEHPPGKTGSDALLDFIEETIGDDNIRVDENFGYGYVRLRSSEAQKRQAAQDIRSNEDILIELLRNSRDAGANNIFIASSKTKDLRTIVVLDDGSGIPLPIQQKVFEPRVTSKLDTAHMDKWGMHGRGMALYSIKVNAKEAFVAASEPDFGTALKVVSDCTTLQEKADQSTFPRFEFNDGVYTMRGPKNLIRTAAEFALAHASDVNVYLGSPLEIAAVIYEYGCSSIQPAVRAFKDAAAQTALFKRLSFSADPKSFQEYAAYLGLDISERSARRVMDGQIPLLDTMAELVRHTSFETETDRPSARKRKNRSGSEPLEDALKLHLDGEDVRNIEDASAAIMDMLAQKYYLKQGLQPSISTLRGKVRIELPVVKDD